jgi:PKD repeat protein
MARLAPASLALVFCLVAAGAPPASSWSENAYGFVQAGAAQPPRLATEPLKSQSPVVGAPRLSQCLGSGLASCGGYVRGGAPVPDSRNGATLPPVPKSWSTTLFSGKPGAELTYDGWDGYPIAVGGGCDSSGCSTSDTWRYANGSWSLIPTALAPPPRSYEQMAYDSLDGYVLLFGGQITSHLGGFPLSNDTWLYRSGHWSLVSLGVAPSPRWGETLVADPVDGSVILFGGFDSWHPGGLNDTWRFSYGSWTNISASVGPSPSSRGGAMASFDAAAGYVVLFGGYSDDGYYNLSALHNDTWSFQPSGWSQISPVAGHQATARYDGSIMDDATEGGIVMFGGRNLTSNYLRDGWLFSAGRWDPLPPSVPYLQSADGTVVPSVFDVKDQFGLYFAYDGATWTRIGNSWNLTGVDSYPGYVMAGAAYDRTDGYAVTFGGTQYAGSYSNATWAFSAGVWSASFPAPSPAGRVAPGMAFDSADAYVLLFGGALYGGTLTNDTWGYSHGGWTRLNSLSGAPSPRWGALLADDPADGCVVLFGGVGANQVPLNDTWVFSNGSWTKIRNGSSAAPPPTSYGGLVYDANLRAVILYSGLALGGAQNETWEYSAGVWTQLFPAHNPGPVYGFAIAADAGDGYVLMADGNGLESWAYNGTDWLLLETPGTSDGAVFANMVDDEHDGFVILFNGDSCGDCPSSWTMKWSPYNLDPISTLTANALLTPSGGTAPLAVDFSVEVAGGEKPYGFTWTYGDHLGEPGLQQNVTYTFTKAGTWPTTLVVRDALGDLATRTLYVSVAPTPQLLAVGDASPAVGPVPLLVHFSLDGSGGVPPYAVSWSFGDGGVGVGINASHTYVLSGEYEAVATLTDAIGGTVDQSVYVHVTEPLTAQIIASPAQGTAPLTLNFTAFVGGGAIPYQFQWTFGDGSTALSQSPEHLYSGPGVYQGHLAVTDSVGTVAEANATVTVLAPLVESPLVVHAVASPSSGTAPLVVNFSGSVQGGVGPYVYSWYFPDGGSATGSVVTHTFSTIGTVQVVLVVTDARSTSAEGVAVLEIIASPSGVGSGSGIGLPPAGSEAGIALAVLAGAAIGVCITLVTLGVLRRTRLPP